MRKRFWLVILIPLVIVIAVVWIFHNRWIESGIEYAAEEVVGAKVEIDNLHVTFSPLGIEWSKIQIANPQHPWKNLFETGDVHFAMDFNQLLRGKYIVDELTVSGLVIDTKRKTDGSLDPERRKRALLAGDKFTFSKLADDALKNMINYTPLFDVNMLKNGFNADSLVKKLDMKTLKHIDTLKRKVDALNNQWLSVKTDFETQKQKVLDLKNQIELINPDQLNDVQSISSAIITVDKSIKTFDEIKSLIENKSVSVKTNIQQTVTSVGQIDGIVKSDFEKLKSMARLPSINKNGIAQLLVGTEMYKRAQNYLLMADKARTEVKQYQGEPDYEEVPRMVGQDVKFPTDRYYPKFWIKKIIISGSTSSSSPVDIQATGSAFNIAENQKVTGLPTTISIEGTANNTKTLKLSGLIDRRNKIPLDKFSASLTGVPISNFSLGKSDFLPTNISSGVINSELEISVPGKNFDASAKFNLKNITLQFVAEPKNTVEELVQRALAGIREFNVQFRLWNTGGPFDIALSTDLDEVLTQRISSVLGEEVDKLQLQLKQKFDAVVQNELKKFNEMYKAKLADINNQLNGYQTLITEQLNLVESKKQELTDQLDKQKQNFLKDKLKGLLGQ